MTRSTTLTLRDARADAVSLVLREAHGMTVDEVVARFSSWSRQTTWLALADACRAGKARLDHEDRYRLQTPGQDA